MDSERGSASSSAESARKLSSAPASRVATASAQPVRGLRWRSQQQANRLQPSSPSSPTPAGELPSSLAEPLGDEATPQPVHGLRWRSQQQQQAQQRHQQQRQLRQQRWEQHLQAQSPRTTASKSTFCDSPEILAHSQVPIPRDVVQSLSEENSQQVETLAELREATAQFAPVEKLKKELLQQIRLASEAVGHLSVEEAHVSDEVERYHKSISAVSVENRGLEGGLLRSTSRLNSLEEEVKITHVTGFKPGTVQPLTVAILSTTGVHRDGFAGDSENYCTVEFQGQHGEQMRTSVQQGTLNATWNHEQIFDNYVVDQALFFKVWSKKKGPNAKLVGVACLAGERVTPDGCDALELPFDSGKTAGTVNVRAFFMDQGSGKRPDQKEGPRRHVTKEADGVMHFKAQISTGLNMDLLTPADAVDLILRPMRKAAATCFGLDDPQGTGTAAHFTDEIGLICLCFRLSHGTRDLRANLRHRYDILMRTGDLKLKLEKSLKRLGKTLASKVLISDITGLGFDDGMQITVPTGVKSLHMHARGKPAHLVTLRTVERGTIASAFGAVSGDAVLWVYDLPASEMPTKDFVELMQLTRPLRLYMWKCGFRAQPANVVFTVTLKNVNYDLLARNAALLQEFKNRIVASVAVEVGAELQHDHVEVEVSSGSVVLDFTIIPPADMTAAAVCAKLNACTSMVETLETSIETVPGIEKVTSGKVSVVRITTPTIEAHSPAVASSGWTQEAQAEAATRIQAIYRGNKGRKEFNEQKLAVQELAARNQAATKIQAVQRGKAARKELEEQKLEAQKLAAQELEAQELAAQELAATKIQAAQRGKAVRKKIEAEAASNGFQETEMTLNIDGVDYDKLTARPPMTATFKKIIKRAVVQEAGDQIKEKSIQVELSKGSVLATIKVLEDDRDIALSVIRLLKSSSSLTNVIETSISGMPGISAVKNGPIVVSAADSEEVTEMTLKIDGVDYDKLMSRPPTTKTIKKIITKAVIQEVGKQVKENNVQVGLSKGSILATIKILGDDRDVASNVIQQLKSSSSLTDSIATSISGMPAINAVKNGPIVVSTADSEDASADTPGKGDAETSEDGEIEVLPVVEEVAAKIQADFQLAYLPKQVKGKDILVKESRTFLVTKKFLGGDSARILYRKTKHLADKLDQQGATWETRVVAVDEDEEWIAIQIPEATIQRNAIYIF